MNNEETKGKFYLVTAKVNGIPTVNHLAHGYEDRWDFLRAVEKLASQWKGRVGECVDSRHDFCLLRFHDTPGGMPDEEWLPKYILKEADGSDSPVEDDAEPPEEEKSLDTAFMYE